MAVVSQSTVAFEVVDTKLTIILPQNISLEPCWLAELEQTIATKLEKLLSESVSELPPTGTATSAPFFPIYPNKPLVNQVFEFIETHFKNGISLKDVAKAVGYSPAYLTYFVGRQTGKAVYCWIVSRRMAEACSLLRESDRTIEDVAAAVGYNYTHHFFTRFKATFGTTPQNWRRSIDAKRSQN